MASLQKIRNHGALLIAIVGLAMLAFILGDFLNSGSSFFNRSRENVGVIEGQKVHYTEYEAAKEQLTEVYKIESGRSDFDEDTYSQIRNQVWNMFVMDYTLRAQAEKIGMDITPDELTELCVGENVHQILRGRRPFMDENGQFSRETVKQLISAINEGSDASKPRPTGSTGRKPFVSATCKRNTQRCSNICSRLTRSKLSSHLTTANMA